jgi:polyhydroxyalkanoate synthase subunit PhaC
MHVLAPSPWAGNDRGWEMLRAVLGARDTPVGTTPKQPIWRKNKAHLYRYRRRTMPTRRTPVLLVGPLLIRRAYILDLRPGASFVQFLLDRGFDLYVLDWLNSGDEDLHVDLDTLITRYLLRALRKVSHAAGGRSISILGLSSGGVFAACLLALHPNAPVKNLLLLSTPIDFSDAGYLGTRTVGELAAGSAHLEPLPGGHAKGLVPVARLAEVFPAVPTQLPIPNPPDLEYVWLSRIFNPLPRTLPTRVGAYVRLWDRLGDPQFDVRDWQALYRWLNEWVPFPGAAFHQWIEDFYQHNKLAKGRLQLSGRPVRLVDIRVPLLNVAGLDDTVTPRSSTGAIMRLVGSEDREELVVEGGHVGVIVGRGASTDVWPRVGDWLEHHD